MGQLAKWTLKSLTIGPQLHNTNTRFWEEAFDSLPPLPSVDNVTIIYTYPTAGESNTDCWEYFDRVLTRLDLFPALRSVRTQESIRSPQYNRRIWWDTDRSLRRLRERGILTCKLLASD